MGAGKPNFQKLHELGKLPENARGNIPLLKELDDTKKRIKELEAEVAELKGAQKEEVEIKCGEEGCEFVAKGTQGQAENRLRLHGRTHAEKKEVE